MNPNYAESDSEDEQTKVNRLNQARYQTPHNRKKFKVRKNHKDES